MQRQVEHFEIHDGGGGDNDDSDYLNSSITDERDIEKDECKELLRIGANSTANTSGDKNNNEYNSKGKGGRLKQYQNLFTSYKRRRRLNAIAMALGFFIVGAVLYAAVTRGGEEGNGT